MNVDEYAKFVYMASHESGYEIIEFDTDVYSYKDVNVYSVCGSMAILHIIAINILNPKSFTFVDVNPVQVAWSRAQIELIKKSENLNDYLKRLYCRDFGNDPKNLVYTEPDDNWEIDDVFKDVKDLAVKLKMAKPDKVIGIKEQNEDRFDVLKLDIIKPYADLNDDKELHHWDKDYTVQVCHAITNDYTERRRNIHFIYNGWGFHSNEGFLKVKNYLKYTPTTFKTKSIFDITLEDKCYVYLSTVWVMDDNKMLKMVFDKRKTIKKGDTIIRGRYLKVDDVTQTLKRYMNFHVEAKRFQLNAERVADRKQIRYILSKIDNIRTNPKQMGEHIDQSLKKYIDRYKKDKKFQSIVDKVIQKETDSTQTENILSKIVDIVEYEKLGITESDYIIDKSKNIIGDI
jgi:hypothetical protein